MKNPKSTQEIGKVCTCQAHRHSFPQIGKFCPHCGEKLTFEHCQLCNGTGDAECLKCHGVIHRGCAVCQGSGYSPRHDCSHTAHTTTHGSGKGHGTFAIAAIPRSANSATQLCAYCNGTGKVPGSLLGTAEDCPLCGGKGQITPEPPSQSGGGWLWLMASLAFLGLMFG